MSAFPFGLRRWLAFVGAGILLLVGGLSFLNRTATLHGEDGVLWVEEDGQIGAARVATGSPADQAGILRGDILVAIDQAPVVRSRQVRDLLWGKGGVPVRYRIRHADAFEDYRVVPALNGEENRIFYYLWVAGILGLGAGVLAFWKLPGDPASPLLFLLSASLYLLLAFSPSGRGGLLDWTFYWGDLAGRLFTPPLLLHFILRAGEEAEPGAGRRPGRRAALYLPAAALLALNLYLIPLRQALAFADPAAVMALKDRLEILSVSLYSAAALALLALRLWTATRARTRWRLRWLALSVLAGLFPLAVLYLLPTALDVPAGTVGELSVFPVALIPLGFAATLFQERTVDLGRTLRTAVRATLGGAVFLAGGAALSWALGHLPGGRPQAGVFSEVLLPLGLSALLTSLAQRPLKRLADSLLGQAPPQLTHALLEFRSVLNGEIQLQTLALRFVGRLKRVFVVDPAMLMVRQGSTHEFLAVPAPALEDDSIPRGLSLEHAVSRRLAAKEIVILSEGMETGCTDALLPFIASGCRYLFPLTVQGDLKALLLVGAHRDGSPLEAAELETLAVLAAQAARSVDGARLYREIEERMAGERELRLQSQGILEASRIGIVLVDGEGRVSAANRALEEILGRRDCVGERLPRLLPRGLLLLLDRSGRRAIGGEDGRVYRYSFGRADGKARIVNVTRATLPGESGIGQVYTLDDVTEEVLREEKMLRQEHLASVGLLASQVAHEVNTPLTGIASYAQILMSRMTSRLPEMDLLRKIEAQAYRAAGIAGSVLSFTRRREGEAAEILEPGAVVSECLTLFEPHLQGKRIRLATERAGSLPAIRGHRGRLQQAVMNLLLNAAEALPGGGEIRLELDHENGCLRIRITDNGVGIPPEVMPRIFEPFFTARPDGGGTGLGLSVVRQVVQEHGGRIDAQSIPGSGSSFTITLPAEAAPEKSAIRGA